MNRKIHKSKRFLLFSVIGVRLTVIPVKGDEKWELLSKIVDKLESRETKKADKVWRFYNHRRILRLQELPDWNKIRCNSSNYPEEKFQV